MITYEPCTEEGEPITPQKIQRRQGWNWLLATRIADLTMPGGWYSGSVNQGEWLKAISMVVKGYVVKSGPKAGATYPPRSPELVWETVEAMWMGAFPDFKREYFRNVFAVNAGSPISYIERVAKGKHIPLPPPTWHESDYDKWQKRWGDEYLKFHPESKEQIEQWRLHH